MTYREQLHPWCIVRHTVGSDPQPTPPLEALSDPLSGQISEQLIVARFRRRNNAEDHLKRMQRLSPDCLYSITFDPNMPKASSASRA